MKSTRVLIRAKGRGLCIERGLYDCLQKELFADVTLKCEGGKIRANKGVLAAASPVLCHLLKDWPITEDPCVIMAGYTEEEVQGLVRYIYTGQLSAPRIHGSSWEKIIGDFKVGSPLESDDDLASIHELTDYGESSPVYEPETNGICHLQQQHQQQTYHNMPVRNPINKGVGPKIVAVTSPRPLIVQVQSLTQTTSSNQGMDVLNDCNDIPSEMTVEEENGDLVSDVSLSPVVAKRKRGGGRLPKRLQRTKQPLEPRVSAVSAVPGAAKKLAVKRAKPTSKFARKKYVCPHCNRRFLTRGNVKNHLRIHSRDKPFQCPICQDLFAYHGVYQRHLIKHRDNNEMGENELAPLIAESLRLADEIGMRERKSVRVIDDEEPEPEHAPKKEVLKGTANDLLVDADIDANSDADADEDENTELIEDEEAKIALKLQSKTKQTGSSKTSSDERAEDDPDYEFDEDKEMTPEETEVEENKVRIPRKREVANPSAKSRQSGTAAKDMKEPKPRMNYQVIQCDFCPMKYHKWSAFYIHRCTHTGETPLIPCGICEMEFPNIKALKEHKITEHRESIFQCEECDRAFLSKSALLMHQPIHSTNLNYPCRYCSEKLRTLKERYVHERTHTTEETPYQCSHCKKHFSTLVNLRCHLKSHGKEAESSPA